MTDLLDQLNAMWSQIIEVTSRFVVPDWSALVSLLPVLLFIGVVVPALTLAVLVWFIYIVRKPRAKVTVAEGVRLASIGADGEPEFPPGLPYCQRDRLIYPSGTSRCADCRDDLVVTCPMCGLGRDAGISTCGNCGLVLRVEARSRVLRPASGPPPGGAATA